uniref:O-phosphoseryl-tRNA(Sec) selenium transferase n=2 Tax=Schistocephalus solidus TaxID=70667 RepID=A0A0V0J2I3_SCHSO
MDSNNWTHSAGVGEREGRILLNLVKRRHFGLAHGVGRSGDITAVQPKAPGSSLINRLVNAMLLDWLRRSGAPSTSACFLVPMATGMALMLCLLALKRRRGPEAKYVIWPRIDQKSCIKCMVTTGLIPVPIEPIRSVGSDTKGSKKGCDLPADQLVTNLAAIEEAIQDPQAYLASNFPGASYSTPAPIGGGPNTIVCIFTTTSCFSPRVPDRLTAVSRLCVRYGIPHLVNNAYGVQSKRCMRMIESSWKVLSSNSTSSTEPSLYSVESNGIDDHRIGQLSPPDFLYVQSTDKNLMVPVGGAIIAGFSNEIVKQVAESYPGRASGTPAIDIFATLLCLGWRGWQDLIDKREACYRRLADGLTAVGSRHGLRLMHTPDNPISLAVGLGGLPSNGRSDTLTKLGARLFTQGCSGVRVVIPAEVEAAEGRAPTCVGGICLPGFNSHSASSTEAYLNAAAAIGQTPEEIDLFLGRLDKILSEFTRRIPQEDNKN